MKKAFILALFLLPSVAFADFNVDLHYGSKGDDVTALQEYLTDQGVYSGPISGNFYSLTLTGVKKFQAKNNISPISGYVGPITRGVINADLASTAVLSEGDATITPVVIQPVVAPPSPEIGGVGAPVAQPVVPIANNPTPMAPVDVSRVPSISIVHNTPIADTTYLSVTFDAFNADGTENPNAHLVVTSNAPWWWPNAATVCSKLEDRSKPTVSGDCNIKLGVQYNFGTTAASYDDHGRQTLYQTGTFDSAGTYTMTATWGDISTTTTITVASQ